MLTKVQANRAWQEMAASEIRALYFAELANQYVRRKQWLDVTTFTLSSGMVVSAFAGLMPTLLPVLLGIAVATLTGVAMGSRLDEKAAVITKLHASWNHLAWDYEHLWNHWNESHAERTLATLQQRTRELSQLGTSAPYKPKRIHYWREHWKRHVYPTFFSSVAANA